MKKFSLISLLICCLVFSACNKDALIESFVNDLDSTTKDMIAKINANPDSGGVAEAQKIFDAKKSDLKKDLSAVNQVMGLQFSNQAKKKLTGSITDNGQALANCLTKLAGNKDASEKLQALQKEYMTLFIPPGSDEKVR